MSFPWILAVLATGACLILLHERFSLQAERDLALARLDDLEESDGNQHERFQAFAGEVVRPITGLLQASQRKLEALEKERERDHAELASRLKGMSAANRNLRRETSRLVQALRKPNVRGRYGEMQLERVAELAGMRSYCDFATQESVRDADGRLRRPDMIVRLPNERVLVIDAKTNIDAYIDALDCDDPDEADEHMGRFADHVAEQSARLARKAYWSCYDGSPEFVVMFVPGDQFVDAALARRPDLLESAAERRVILASPSTLIGLLRAVQLGWREQSISDDAEELLRLGSELHERAGVALEHAARLGRSLDQVNEHYERFVGSVDARLMPTLRRFEASGAASSRVLEEPPRLERARRAPMPARASLFEDAGGKTASGPADAVGA